MSQRCFRSISSTHFLLASASALALAVACGDSSDGDEGTNNGPGAFTGTLGVPGAATNAAPNNPAATNGMQAPTPSGQVGSNVDEAGNNADSFVAPNQQNANGDNQGSGAQRPAEMNNGAGGGSMVDPQGETGGSGMAAPEQPTDTGAGGGSMDTPAPIANTCDGAAFFCEDFDALNLGALQADPTRLTPENQVSVVAEPGRGQVLQVNAEKGYGNKSGVFLNQFSPPNNSYYGRMYARVAQFPAAGADHWVMVEANGNNGGANVRPVGGQFDKWAPGSDGDASGDWTDHDDSQAFVQDGEWACVEWQMDGANGNNDMLLWVDDTQVTPRDHGGFTIPAISRLWIGWVVYQGGQESYDVQVDDLVLSTERVGCN